MNKIQSQFSIKDLENLSGIKAHTIRIWEKRYQLLEPERTDTNIRTYDISNLQRLLNVTFLYNHGYKISKIASLKGEQIQLLVGDLAKTNRKQDKALHDFKLSMLNFDQMLFQKTYANLSKTLTFREIFYEVFIPLLSEIGMLWQTNTITPAHEHFISTFIRQKIVANTENAQMKKTAESDKVFVLFLPDNEIHELGLLFINYELVLKNKQTIFLGQSVPMESLENLLHYFDDITFISYFTIKPERTEIKKYIRTFSKTILKNTSHQLYLIGRMVEDIRFSKLENNIKIFKLIDNLLNES